MAKKQFKKLHSNKTSFSNDITVSITKNFTGFSCDKFRDILNKCLKEKRFPNLMNISKITPVFRKLDSTSKNKYRPISTWKHMV